MKIKIHTNTRYVNVYKTKNKVQYIYYNPVDYFNIENLSINPVWVYISIWPPCGRWIQAVSEQTPNEYLYYSVTWHNNNAEGANKIRIVKTCMKCLHTPTLIINKYKWERATQTNNVDNWKQSSRISQSAEYILCISLPFIANIMEDGMSTCVRIEICHSAWCIVIHLLFLQNPLYSIIWSKSLIYSAQFNIHFKIWIVCDMWASPWSLLSSLAAQAAFCNLRMDNVYIPLIC